VTHQFLAHQAGDSVAVAVTDITPGTHAKGRYQDDDGPIELDVVDSVPLGHKIALMSVGEGQPIVKYGVKIGRATADISPGQHVHVHNVKGERWA
jgi:(2R)-sulfolactate sulfo-lyase subunit alpha